MFNDGGGFIVNGSGWVFVLMVVAMLFVKWWWLCFLFNGGGEFFVYGGGYVFLFYFIFSVSWIFYSLWWLGLCL